MHSNQNTKTMKKTLKEKLELLIDSMCNHINYLEQLIQDAKNENNFEIANRHTIERETYLKNYVELNRILDKY